MLKWLRTGAWPKLTDVLTAIRQELQSVQPIDTASIRWEKDAEGMRAYYTGRTGGGEGLTVDEGGESAVAPSYNGYFTIKLKIIDGDTYAFVCDGATWNEENETSSNSPIYVNNRYYLIPVYKHPTPITESTSIAIHWKNAIPADKYATPPVAATPATASILFTNNPLPQDSPTEIYRQIGRILYSNGVANVIQDHTSGVMYAVVYAICSYK
jgi:hypothetical protein